jgi:hypothetical protein
MLELTIKTDPAFGALKRSRDAAHIDTIQRVLSAASDRVCQELLMCTLSAAHPSSRIATTRLSGNTILFASHVRPHCLGFADALLHLASVSPVDAAHLAFKRHALAVASFQLQATAWQCEC